MDNQQPSNNLFYQKPKIGYGYIYKYTSPSNKSYIGQTINSLAERAKNITSGIGYKKCSLFWKAITKYSFTNFNVEIIETAPVERLNELEKYYINKFNTLAPNGYNLTIGGESGKTIQVYVYSAQNGQLLEHYNSLSEASLSTGVPIETVSLILSNKTNRKIAHNLTFSKEFYEKIDLMDLSRSNYHNVYLYNLNGDYIDEFQTIADAANKLRMSESTIARHLKLKTSSCGYYFRDEKMDKIEPIEKQNKKGKIVRQIDPITLYTIHTYNSLASAAKSVGLASSCSITRAIERGGKAKGFYWQIIEGSTTMDSENPTEAVRDIRKDEDIV